MAWRGCTRHAYANVEELHGAETLLIDLEGEGECLVCVGGPGKSYLSRVLLNCKPKVTTQSGLRPRFGGVYAVRSGQVGPVLVLCGSGGGCIRLQAPMHVKGNQATHWKSGAYLTRYHPIFCIDGGRLSQEAVSVRSWRQSLLRRTTRPMPPYLTRSTCRKSPNPSVIRIGSLLSVATRTSSRSYPKHNAHSRVS